MHKTKDRVTRARTPLKPGTYPWSFVLQIFHKCISLEIFVFLFFNLLLFLHYRKVAKRLPYYVTCDEPVIPPDPPKIHMENMETFFYNTIPKRPMAYTIHKEWVSEVIHAKRMELQKREGIKHRWKNFAFVY